RFQLARRDSRTPEDAESPVLSDVTPGRLEARPTTEVQYLKPGERSGHDIALKLNINAGVAIEETECATHVVTKKSPSAERLTVTLSPNDRIPNKDFVFRFRVAGAQMKSGLLTSRDELGGFFT